MAGMQFEYDEQGGTFYYFLLSFVALVLIPATYYLWPRKTGKDDQKRGNQCHCEPCQAKRQAIRSARPRRVFQQTAIKVALGIGWIFFIYIAYKTSQVELEFKEFDPYAELEIDRGAPLAEIKKAYRKLSLIYHPDRETGDARKFMKITKAHDALTNEESRKNWEEYGNPDGPGATQVGIALPKWIVEKQNSIWVLGLYALIFMIILPVCVGTWWYRSIKYSAQQVLIDTTKLYFQLLRKSQPLLLKRVIMVLSASCEFWKRFNGEIIERPSDNTEIPELIRDLPGFSQSREIPFVVPYCVKVRALLEAHFTRKELPVKTLEIDKQYILKKCPYLLNEMLFVAQQLEMLAQSQREQWRLSSDLVENIMKASQMIIQGLGNNKSPLLQLPHIKEEMLRHFVTKKRNIRSFQQLVSMKEEDRRALLRQLSDAEYRDVMNVVASLPNVKMGIRCEVKGEEDKTVTAGSVVTVTVRLERHNMAANISPATASLDDFDEEIEEEKEEDGGEEEEEESQMQNAPGTPPTQKTVSKWAKNKKKKAAPKKAGKKKTGSNVTFVKKTVGTSHDDKKDANSSAATDEVQTKTDKKKDSRTKRTGAVSSTAENHSTDEEHVTDEESSDEAADAKTESGNAGEAATALEEVDVKDDDDEWMAFQNETKKDNMLETKSKETHLVHSPYFPLEKYEWWWLYLAESKKKHLTAGPLQVCTLRDVEEKELRFAAPLKPGNYQYSVVLRSDSYMGVDQSQQIKIDVKEAKKVAETHPQWDMSDDEDNKKTDHGSESDSGSEDDSSVDDDD